MMGMAILDDLFTLVDMFFVGRLGPAALAAVAVAGTIIGVLIMVAVGLTTGCTALVAQAVGAGDRRRAEVVSGQALSMAMIVAAVAAVLSLFCRPMLAIFGADQAVVHQGSRYLQASLLGALPVLLTITFSAALRGAGDATTPLKIIGIGNLINIFLDPLMIFGWLGFPALGVAGSAWATVISRAFCSIWLARLFFVDGHRHFKLRLVDLFPRAAIVWQMTRIGAFSSGQMLILNLSAVALVRIVAALGTAAIAAYGIAMRIGMVMMMPGMGFGNAAATLVGQNLGACKPKRAELAGWAVVGMYVVMAIVMSAACLVFARPIVAFFNPDPLVVGAGVAILRWFCATFVFVALSIVLGRAMGGAGDTFWPMVMTAVSMLGIRIPLAWWLSVIWGLTGILAAIAVSSVVQGSLAVLLFHWGRWKQVGHRHLSALRGQPAA